MNRQNEVVAVLTGWFGAAGATEVLKHFTALKNALQVGDFEKTLLRCGKFVEAVLRGFSYARTGASPKNIHVGKRLTALENDQSLDGEARSLIISHLRTLNAFRNKRGGGHSSFDPMRFDAQGAAGAATWTLVELLRLAGDGDEHHAERLATAVAATSIPFIEVIDGTPLVLIPGASARTEILLTLYSRYPETVARRDLGDWLKPIASSNVTNSLNRLQRDKLVFSGTNGLTLTRLGVRAAEDAIASQVRE